MARLRDDYVPAIDVLDVLRASRAVRLGDREVTVYCPAQTLRLVEFVGRHLGELRALAAADTESPAARVVAWWDAL